MIFRLSPIHLLLFRYLIFLKCVLQGHSPDYQANFVVYLTRLKLLLHHLTTQLHLFLHLSVLPPSPPSCSVWQAVYPLRSSYVSELFPQYAYRFSPSPQWLSSCRNFEVIAEDCLQAVVYIITPADSTNYFGTFFLCC